MIVRDHEVEHGHFSLDPCNLHRGEAEVVADRIVAELLGAGAPGGPDLHRRRAQGPALRAVAALAGLGEAPGRRRPAEECVRCYRRANFWKVWASSGTPPRQTPKVHVTSPT